MTPEQLAQLKACAQDWCDAVERDTSWDSWDHHYKRMKYEILPALAASPAPATTAKDAERASLIKRLYATLALAATIPNDDEQPRDVRQHLEHSASTLGTDQADTGEQGAVFTTSGTAPAPAIEPGVSKQFDILSDWADHWEDHRSRTKADMERAIANGEPVAWISEEAYVNMAQGFYYLITHKRNEHDTIPLYATPPASTGGYRYYCSFCDTKFDGKTCSSCRSKFGGVNGYVRENSASTDAAAQERRNPLEAYADSYAQMSRGDGDGRVSCYAVEVDIRQNMMPHWDAQEREIERLTKELAEFKASPGVVVQHKAYEWQRALVVEQGISREAGERARKAMDRAEAAEAARDNLKAALAIAREGLAEAEAVVAAVAGENQPSRQWATEVRDRARDILARLDAIEKGGE